MSRIRITAVGQSADEYSAMRKPVALLIFVFLALAAASLVQDAGASGCSACSGKVPDWTETATDFLNGKVVDNTPQLFGPKASRMKNEKFNSEFNSGSDSNAESDLAQGGSASGTVETPTIDIDLLNISAQPNPVISGSDVKIAAVFGMKNETEMTARASIKNMAGEEVGKLTLEPVSQREFAGIWKANVAAGTYAVDVIGAGRDLFKSFNDSLRIDVAKATGAMDYADASEKTALSPSSIA